MKNKLMLLLLMALASLLFFLLYVLPIPPLPFLTSEQANDISISIFSGCIVSVAVIFFELRSDRDRLRFQRDRELMDAAKAVCRLRPLMIHWDTLRLGKDTLRLAVCYLDVASQVKTCPDWLDRDRYIEAISPKRDAIKNLAVDNGMDPESMSEEEASLINARFEALLKAIDDSIDAVIDGYSSIRFHAEMERLFENASVPWLGNSSERISGRCLEFARTYNSLSLNEAKEILRLHSTRPPWWRRDIMKVIDRAESRWLKVSSPVVVKRDKGDGYYSLKVDLTNMLLDSLNEIVSSSSHDPSMVRGAFDFLSCESDRWGYHLFSLNKGRVEEMVSEYGEGDIEIIDNEN